jgi:hypothetical protein
MLATMPMMMDPPTKEDPFIVLPPIVPPEFPVRAQTNVETLASPSEIHD